MSFDEIDTDFIYTHKLDPKIRNAIWRTHLIVQDCPMHKLLFVPKLPISSVPSQWIVKVADHSCITHSSCCLESSNNDNQSLFQVQYALHLPLEMAHTTHLVTVVMISSNCFFSSSSFSSSSGSSACSTKSRSITKLAESTTAFWAISIISFNLDQYTNIHPI